MNDTIFLIVNNKEFPCRKSYMTQISPTIQSFYKTHSFEDCFSCEIESFDKYEKIFRKFLNNEHINITFDSIPFIEKLSRIFGISIFDKEIKMLKDNCRNIFEDQNNLIYQFGKYSDAMFVDSIESMKNALTIENSQTFERFFFSLCFIRGIPKIQEIDKVIKWFESQNHLPELPEFYRLASMDSFILRVKENFLSEFKSPLLLTKLSHVFDTRDPILSNDLYSIIENDDVDSLQWHLREPAFDINCQIYGVSLIEYAAFLSAINCFKLLSNSHARILNRLSHFAVAGGNTEIIHICEQKKCSFKGTLKIAASFHYDHIFSWILDTQKDEISDDVIKHCILYSNFSTLCQIISDVQINVNELLLWASEYCHETLFSWIASIPGIDIDHQDENGQSPLHFACLNGDFFLLSYLLKCNLSRSIDFNIKMKETDITPLHLACQFNHPEIVKELLLIPQVDVNPKTFLKARVTPLHLACKFGHIEIVKLLLADNRIQINSLTYNI